MTLTRMGLSFTARPVARDVAALAHLASPVALGCALEPNAFIRTRHQEYMSRRLVASQFPGGPKRLRFHVPPRHGKSQLVSRWFPVWALTLRPWLKAGIVSFGADLAAEFGRECRNILLDHEQLLGVRILKDSKAAHRWKTSKGGGMVTAGIRGRLTGRGFHLIIVDDPIKDVEEAESPVIQLRNWNWWKGTLLPRLEPDAVIVLMHTRWSQQDLAGKLEEAQKAGPEAEGYDEWETHNLPAIAEKHDPLGRREGEALWPDRDNVIDLAKKRRSMGSYVFSAEFQQRPSPLEGGLLKHHWWRYWVPKGMLELFPPISLRPGHLAIIEELPDTFDVQLQSWDMNWRDSVRAIEEGRKPDPVAGHVWARHGARKYLLDRFHGEIGLNESIVAVREMSKNNPRAVIKLVEKAGNGPAVMGKLKHELGGFIGITPRGTKVARVKMSAAVTDADKGARAISFGAAVEAGDYYIPHPHYRVWAAAFRTMLGLFPKGGKDDTDAASQAWAWMEQRAWLQWDAEHAEAMELGGPPVASTQEIFRRKIESNIKRELPSGTFRLPYDRR